MAYRSVLYIGNCPSVRNIQVICIPEEPGMSNSGLEFCGYENHSSITLMVVCDFNGILYFLRILKSYGYDSLLIRTLLGLPTTLERGASVYGALTFVDQCSYA
ncbi:hypothetical protein T12_9650 [Trichinella patagoniensis]|uniref:Uncharacterized protein n=1 Tax=Trichinella patagoniensis TaxID=990121 RepID=A0A0V0ZDN1_9BILA|nr:hypothetical protein T12_9650 [Trichinella patagoniensis]